MRFDFSTRCFDLMKIESEMLLSTAKSNFLFLLGQDDFPFEVEIVERDELGGFKRISELDPSKNAFYSYIIKKDQLHIDGGTLSFRRNQYWEIDSDRPYCEFSALDIKANVDSPKAVFALALVLAAAKIFQSNDVFDVNEVIFDGLNEGRLEIEKIQSLSVEKGRDYTVALQEFYAKTLIDKLS